MSCERWKEVRLGDVIETNAETLNAKEKLDFINYLDTGNITENEILNIQHINLKEETLPSRAKRKIKKGDIVFSTVRPNQRHYGIINNISPNMIVSTGFTTIRGKYNISYSPFIYYFLSQNDIISHLQAIAEQSVSTYPSIKPSDIENLQLFLPPISEQRAIAATLSGLDDKIELNNRINKTLEEMAQAIFKSWFVYFEPFQGGELYDTESGSIPFGWTVGTLGDICNITSGKRPQYKQSVMDKNALIPLVGASSIMGYTNEVLYNEKILVTGRVGTHGIIQRYNIPCWTSDNTLVIKSNYFEFTYQQLLKVDFRNMNRGSTQPLITQTDLKNVSIILPPTEVLEKFEKLVNSLMYKLAENNVENDKLAEIRDILLPKLMSGEIEV